MKQSLTHAFIAATLMLATNILVAYAAPIPVAVAGQQIDSNLFLTRHEPTSLGLEGDEPTTFLFVGYQDAESKPVDAQTNGTGEDFVEQGNGVNQTDDEIIQQRQSLQRRWLPGGSPRVLTTVDEAIQSSAVQQATRVPQDSLLDDAAIVSQSSKHADKLDFLATSTSHPRKRGRPVSSNNERQQGPLLDDAASISQISDYTKKVEDLAAKISLRNKPGRPLGSKSKSKKRPIWMPVATAAQSETALQVSKVGPIKKRKTSKLDDLSPSDLKFREQWKGKSIESIPEHLRDKVKLVREVYRKQQVKENAKQRRHRRSPAEVTAWKQVQALENRRRRGGLTPPEEANLQEIKQLLKSKGKISIGQNRAPPQKRQKSQAASSQVGAHSHDVQRPDTRVADVTTSYSSLPSSPRPDAVLHNVEDLNRFNESTAFASPLPHSPSNSPSTAFATAPHRSPSTSIQTDAQKLDHQSNSGQAFTSSPAQKDGYYEWLEAQTLSPARKDFAFTW